MKTNTKMFANLSKIFVKAAAFLFVLTVLSCSKISTSDVLPQSLLSTDQYALEVAKTLYTSIKLNNYNFKKTKEDFITNVNNHENDIIRNTSNTLYNNERFNKLFNYTSAPNDNARLATQNAEGLNLENVKSEINSSALTNNVKRRVIELGDKLTVLKAQLNQNNINDASAVKSAIDQVISTFEGSIMNDNSLSSDEKTKLFSFTIATRDNLDNVKQLLTGANSGGRKGCFFCNIVNIFVTIVVAVVVVAVAAVVIVTTAGIAFAGAVIAGTIATAAAVGASLGAAVGIGYAARDNCLDIIDYGQDIYGQQMGFTFAQC